MARRERKEEEIETFRLRDDPNRVLVIPVAARSNQEFQDDTNRQPRRVVAKKQRGEGTEEDWHDGKQTSMLFFFRNPYLRRVLCD